MNIQLKTALLFIVLFSYLISYSPNAIGSKSQSTIALNCQNTVLQKLTEWRVLPYWKPIIPLKKGSFAIRIPTQKIGTWVEIEVSKNTIELQKNSPNTIDLVTFTKSNCKHIATTKILNNLKRKISSKSELFTDDDFMQLVSESKTGVLYFWSPGMPLSIRAFSEFKKAADSLNLKVYPILDPLADVETAKKLGKQNGLPDSSYRKLGSIDLAFRSVTIHYPSMIMFKDGLIVDHLLGGYRTEDEYKNLLKSALSSPSSSSKLITEVELSKLLSENTDYSTTSLSEIKHSCSEDPKTYRKLIEIKNHYENGVGYFQQPISNGRYVSFNMYDHGAIYDLETGTSVKSLEFEPFPTPDGRFITVGSPLRFYSVKEIFEKGKDKVDYLFKDRKLGGWYQSASVISEDKVAKKVRYRILTANDQGVIRDYVVSFNDSWDPIKFEPVQPDAIKLCSKLRSKIFTLTRFDFQMPIISKDGEEFATLSSSSKNKSQTMKFWKINPENGECDETGDLGIKTAKGNFSYDRKYWAFTSGDSRTDPKEFNSFESYINGNKIYVYNRSNGVLIRLAQGINGFTTGMYPGFLPDNKVIYKAIINNKFFIAIEDLNKLCK